MENVKSEIDHAEKSSDRLNGLAMLMKSIGMDKYEETALGGGGWEDALLKVTEEKKETGDKIKIEEYKVVEPMMPEHIRQKKEQANKEAKGLYE